ncbi:hypothetical protein Syun_004480 [Stephania yunnanensis]|uniref:Uncharacterized protein n=1 Tax=Stephania yunnanensis TaxID=152371 RepID=A0AAP0L4H9_9MAGN
MPSLSPITAPSSVPPTQECLESTPTSPSSSPSKVVLPCYAPTSPETHVLEAITPPPTLPCSTPPTPSTPTN